MGILIEVGSSKELFLEFKRTNSLKLRNQIVAENIGLARQAAHDFKRNCDIPYEDLVQIGIIGLIKAVERFDVERWRHGGGGFPTFAYRYIKGELLHFVRDHGSLIKIPRKWREIYAKANAVEKKLFTKTGRIPSLKVVAEAIGQEPSFLAQIKAAISEQSPIELKPTIDREDEKQSASLPVESDSYDELLDLWNLVKAETQSLPLRSQKALIEFVDVKVNAQRIQDAKGILELLRFD